jgi:hypothetical protein
VGTNAEGNWKCFSGPNQTQVPKARNQSANGDVPASRGVTGWLVAEAKAVPSSPTIMSAGRPGLLSQVVRPAFANRRGLSGFGQNEECEKPEDEGRPMKFFVCLALVILAAGSSAFAAAGRCRQIKAKVDREACYDRNRKALPLKRQAGGAADKVSADPVDQLKIENDRLSRRLRSICRGC